MTFYVLMMVVNLYGYKDMGAVWVAAPVLGNPFSKISDCGRAQTKMETASGRVGKYKCEPRHKKMEPSPG